MVDRITEQMLGEIEAKMLSGGWVFGEENPQEDGLVKGYYQHSLYGKAYGEAPTRTEAKYLAGLEVLSMTAKAQQR